MSEDLALAAWNARQHDVHTHRTRKGATVQEVTHYGAATVRGSLDCDVNGLPLLAASPRDSHVLHPSSAAARQLVIAAERESTEDSRRAHHVIGRKRFGLSALDVLRITDATYREHGLEPLLTGTEVRQYEQVIHRDRAASSRATAHSVGLTGGRTDITIEPRLMLRPTCHADGTYSVSCGMDTTLPDCVAQAGANVPQTPSLKAWPTRGLTGDTRFGRLPLARRNSDPSTARVHAVASDGTATRVVEVVTASDDTERLFVGHRVIEREPAVVKTETARADRTTITATAGPASATPTADRPTTERAWTRLLAKLEPGKRADLGDVTCTVNKRGDYYRATVREATGSRHLKSRTAQGLARLLAA